MPAERKAGYDHPWFAFDALADRAPTDDCAVAVHIMPLVVLELYEDPLPEWPQLKSVGGGLDRAFPNISRVSTREYGNRVGIFRMLEAYERHAMVPTVAIDAMTAETYPWLVRYLAERDVSWVAHGISITRPLGSHLSATEESDYIADTRRRLAACGIETDAWFGPDYGQSERTPGLLAAHGYRYTLDWCGDEQIVPIATAEGRLASIPLSADLDDQTTLINRMAEPAAYRRHLLDAVTELSTPDRFGARVLGFAVRPWVTGQPFRIGILDDLLEHIDRLPSAAVSTWQQIAATVPTTAELPE